MASPNGWSLVRTDWSPSCTPLSLLFTTKEWGWGGRWGQRAAAHPGARGHIVLRSHWQCSCVAGVECVWASAMCAPTFMTSFHLFSPRHF